MRLSTAIPSFALLLLAAIPAAAQDGSASIGQETYLSGDQIRELAAGNTTIGTFADRALSYAVYVAPDGVLIGRLWDGKTERIELGTWRVERDRLIGKWDRLKAGSENAFAYVAVGENVHAVRDDGSIDRIQFFVEGDPLGLDERRGDNTNLEITFRRILEDQYFHLWRDTPEEPFDISEGRNLYLQDERLTALDTDALAVPGQGSRITGWKNYAPIWPTAFEAIRLFEPGPVLNLNVRPQGGWVLTDFDMAGRAVLESGEELEVFKHFTLVWLRTSDGWRILHEHISDTRKPE